VQLRRALAAAEGPGAPDSDGRQLILGHAGELAQKGAHLLLLPVIKVICRSAPFGAHVGEESADLRGPTGRRSRRDRHHAGPETISLAVNFIPLLDPRIAPALSTERRQAPAPRSDNALDRRRQCQEKWPDPPLRLAVELADVTACVRTRFCLAARPKKREYSRLFGVHLGNPGSVERLSEEGDENGGE
jgi:hypothetical protein